MVNIKARHETTQMVFVMLVFLVVFSTNLVLFLFARYLTSETADLVSIYRDIGIVSVILVSIFIAVIRRKKVAFSFFSVFIFLVAILLTVILLRSSMTNSQLYYYRQFLLVWFFWYWGYSIGTAENHKKIMRAFFYLIGVVSLLSILFFLWGRYLPTACDWFNSYTRIKSERNFQSDYCLPRNALTYSFSFIVEGPIVRNFGIILAPPALGIVSSSIVCFLVMMNNYIRPNFKNYFFAMLIIISGILTVSKAFAFVAGLGALLTVLATYSFKTSQGEISKNLLKLLYFTTFLVISGGVIYLGYRYRVNFVIYHTQGLFNAVQSLVTAPFGLGLGTAGNFARNSIINESYFGALITQLGFFGLIIYLVPLVYFTRRIFIIRKIKKKFKAYASFRVIVSVFALWLSIWLSAIFNETSIALVPAAFVFFLLGVSEKATKSKEHLII